jgi:two-component system chemotaxis sensor kinase CheA
MSERATPAVLTIFQEESADRLVSIEAGLLALEDDARFATDELVHAIFRDAHSIKAGANLLGLASIELLAHRLENILDLVRTGKLAPDGPSITAMLSALDAMALLVEDIENSASRDISTELAALDRVAGRAAG